MKAEAMTAEPAAGNSTVKHAPFTNYTDANRADIRELEAIQQSLSMDNTAFSAGADIDATTWGRLKSGTYYTKQGPSKQIVIMQRHVKQLFRRMEKKGTRVALRIDAREYIRFTDYAALVEAVNATLETSERGGENKLTLYVAPSGGGKTRSGQQLMTQEGIKARMVTARPSWSRSYLPALQAIAKALDISHDFRTAHDIESAILEHMERPEDRGVLIINEFELTCKPLQDFLRSILNETSWAILILITPEGYRRLITRGGSGVTQLMRRCEATIEASHLTGAQVQEFMQQHWKLTPELAVAAKEIADNANEFGAFDLICTVLDYLVLEFQDAPPTLAQVRDKLRVYRTSKPRTLQTERRAA
jgi:hypothetical protein